MAADTTLTTFVTTPNEGDSNIDAALHAAGVGDLLTSLTTAIKAAQASYAPNFVPGANNQKRFYDRVYQVIGAYLPGSGWQ